MSTNTHRAIELAESLQQVHDGHSDEGPSSFSEAANELRRLAAIEQELERIKALEHTLVQHKKPMTDQSGNLIGYTNWKSGRGLEWWPHRYLHDLTQPKEST